MRWRLPAMLLLVLGAGLPARAGPGWESDPRHGELVDHEVQELATLLERAQADGLSAQAWWLADQILALDGGHEGALAVVETLTPDDLDRAAVPSERFARARDETLRTLGDAWFHFGEQLEAAGVDPVDYYPVTLRAHRHGSRGGALLAALEQAGFVWLGTFDAEERAKVASCLGDVASRATWPPSWDDAFVRVRARWPAARVVDLGDLRLLGDVGVDRTLALLRALGDIDAWLGTWEGGRAPSPKARGPATAGARYEFLVFGDAATYARLGPEFVDAPEREALASAGTFRARTRSRTLVSLEHPRHPFVAPEATWAGAVAATAAARRWGDGAGSAGRGRGAWLLEGLGAAFEGYVLDEDGRPRIDPGRCWSLAVAAALHAQGRLLPWDELLELDAAAVAAVPRVDVETTIAGTPRALTQVDVVRVQAAALVVGLLLGDGERGRRRFARLAAGLLRRDALPDVDKAMAWKRGRHVQEAERAMEAAHAR